MNTLDFAYADYELAVAYGCHVRRQTTTIHPLLTEQIQLAKPMRPTAIQTTAKARSRNRGCVFFLDWEKCRLPNTFYNFHRDGEAIHLLIFFQAKLGHEQPFRLVVCPVTESFPKVAQLWPMVAEYLAGLPPLAPLEASLESSSEPNRHP
jgi:hypothetical protein